MTNVDHLVLRLNQFTVLPAPFEPIPGRKRFCNVGDGTLAIAHNALHVAPFNTELHADIARVVPRRSRGGGNVGIDFIDFQGLWKGRKTAPSFSALSINRHFHGLLQSPRTLRRRSSSLHPSSLARTASG